MSVVRREEALYVYILPSLQLKGKEEYTCLYMYMYKYSTRFDAPQLLCSEIQLFHLRGPFTITGELVCVTTLPPSPYMTPYVLVTGQ